MSKISILSFNIWFDKTKIFERMDSLLATIMTLDPDVVCLQEVLPVIYEKLKSSLTDHAHHYPKVLKEQYGCVILSKHKINKCLEVPFKNSKMGRKLVIASIKVEKKDQPATDLVVVTSHFESVFSQKVNLEKVEQIKYTFGVLNKLYGEYKNVVFCGDTNIKPEENVYFENSDWPDIWKKCGEHKDKEYTYDTKTNPNLSERGIGAYQSRIDRAIYRCDNFIATSFNLVTGIPGLIHPSDHHGIMFDLTPIALTTVNI